MCAFYALRFLYPHLHPKQFHDGIVVKVTIERIAINFDPPKIAVEFHEKPKSGT